MFDAARLRLTLWYLLILTIIVLLLSGILYNVLTNLLHSEIHELAPIVRRGVANFFARDEHELLLQIIAIDAAVLVPAAAGAYLLAGRTLRPIREAMDRQERFAVAASHELRTPLTVLQGTLDVALLRNRTPEEYKEILSQAAAEAGQMGTLIGDVLALARVQSDREALALELLDLRDVVQEAVDGIRPLVERKGQHLEVASGAELPVRGDRLKLRQLLANLLDNAVTYTPEGGAIRVVVHHERGHATVEVRDTGRGIAAKHLPHLFEPFYRVDEARGDGAEHSGLGLALAHWIARAHGGQIHVASEPDVGSVFALTLPLVPGRSPVQIDVNPAIEPPGSGSIRA